LFSLVICQSHHTRYPYGRAVGFTIYPGLHFAAAALYFLCDACGNAIIVKQACVFLPAVFASLTCVAVYLFTAELCRAFNNTHISRYCGLLAALFMAVVPAFLSRSVVGAFDNECVAICFMCLTYFAWLRSLRVGTVFASLWCAIGYFVMLTSWGGHIIVANTITLHALILLVSGNYSNSIYISFSTWYIFTTLASIPFPMVGFAVISANEYKLPMICFVAIQLAQLRVFIRRYVPPYLLAHVIRQSLYWLIAIVIILLAVLVPLSNGGRLFALFSQSSSISAIVRSVSEHQPTPWSTFFVDLHVLLVLAPVGLFQLIVRSPSTTTAFASSSFAALSLTSAMVASALMVRLLLIVAPIACCLAGIGAYHTAVALYSSASLGQSSVFQRFAADSLNVSKPRSVYWCSFRGLMLLVLCCTLVGWLVVFGWHSVWTALTFYASSAIVWHSTDSNGASLTFDDYREAYSWLKHNTPADSVVGAWWDYGYQISALANRTTIVDNNTRNNTHIALMGYILASSEQKALPLIRQLDINYLMVVCGGFLGYASDDINKFLWPVRIASSVFPDIVEEDYFSDSGEFRIDDRAPLKLRQALAYRMCYYRFDEVYTEHGRPPGYDRVRGLVVGEKAIKFQNLTEVFTTKHWMVRLYRVNPE
jgi:dolichyl-diphosphooligosaccharide--protein glycosyltransferase